MSGVDFAKIDDAHFKRNKKKMTRNGTENFWERSGELTQEDQDNIERKKQAEKVVGEALAKNVKKVEHLKDYLKTRFSLRKNMRPHEMNF